MHDVIVIGGSYAGLSAAMQLARARRDILVVDAGRRRNRFAEASHGFLGRDGASPAAIADEARAQLLAYPTVGWRAAKVVAVGGSVDAFTVRDDAGTVSQGRRLLLAPGVADELPDLPGLAERWGRHVFHCPYCHGYEVEGRIGVLAAAPASIHQALMLPDWGDTTYFLNGTPPPDDEEMRQLAARGVAVEPAPIRRISGVADIELQDGRIVSLGGLFTATRTHPSTPLAEELGCTIEHGPTGSYIATDAVRQTSVTGVFACGDAARPFGSVAIAVGDGAIAGAGLHRSLMFGP